MTEHLKPYVINRYGSLVLYRHDRLTYTICRDDGELLHQGKAAYIKNIFKKYQSGKLKAPELPAKIPQTTPGA